MGLIGRLLKGLFGGGRNVIAETAGVFRVNSEAEAQRGHDATVAALAQFAAEFAQPRKTVFDSIVDGLNRLPRPLFAFGVIFMFVAAMMDPVWFSARMAGFGAIPEQMWLIMTGIVGFYFGIRELQKFRDAQAVRPEQVQAVVESIRRIEAIAQDPDRPVAEIAPPGGEFEPLPDRDDNPALAAWRAEQEAR